ncbi:ALP1-like protein [Tanacetum coccineum]
MSDSSFSDTSDIDDQSDTELIMKVIRYERSLKQQAESSRSRNPIFRERDVVEARLMTDYFGSNSDNPKYPEVADENDNLIVLTNSTSFDNLFDDIAHVAPFEVNAVTFEKGYYMTDGFYPQWATFVKSFPVARDEKNGVFKRRQEGDRKDVEIAFGVLQGRWYIIKQPARQWHIYKIRRIVYTCIILHKVILKDQKFAYPK